MRLVCLYIAFIFLTGCTVQQIQQTLGDYLETDELTTEQVTAGLKEALVKE